MDEFEVELVLDIRANLAEGPVWDEATNELVWVDLTVGAIHRFNPETGQDTSVDVGQSVGAVALREQGGYVLAVRDGFALMDADGTITMLGDPDEGKPEHRMNDGKCDTAGRFWAGTTAMDFTAGASTLYRLDPDHEVVAAIPGLTLSNGLGWSPDDSTMYVIDTFSRRLDAYDFDAATGTPSAGRLLVEYPENESALPDGMTVDAEGYLWVAMYAGSSVRRYAPDGTLDHELRMPVSQPTSCAFGGPDYRDLYITTGNQLKTPEELAAEPTLGGIFRCRPGVQGLPTSLYRG